MTLPSSMLLLNFLERVGRFPSTCNSGCLYRATHTDRPGGDSSKLCCVPAGNSVIDSDAPGTYRRAQGTWHFTLLVKCKLSAMTFRLVAFFVATLSFLAQDCPGSSLHTCNPHQTLYLLMGFPFFHVGVIHFLQRSACECIACCLVVIS